MSDPIPFCLKPGDTAPQVDLSVSAARVVWDVRGIDAWAFETTIKGGLAWPTGATAVLTVKVSENGFDWFTLPTTVTVSAVGMTRPIYVTPYSYIAAEVTTAGGSQVYADITGYGEASPMAITAGSLIDIPNDATKFLDGTGAFSTPASSTITVVDAGGDTTCWVILATSQTGTMAPASDGGMTYNATTHALTATTFIGALTGNASTATKWAATITINGTAVDGSGNVTITAAAGTLTGATLNATVTASSLTSFGSSPTLTTPTIASFTNATHNHQNAAGGGTLDAAAVASGTMATARLGSGSASALTYLRGDQSYAVPTPSHPNSATIFGIPGVSGSAIVTAQASVASTIYYHPIVVLTKITVTAITSRVSNTATAGAKVRFAIYNSDTTWQPTTLVADLGQMAVDGGAGIKTLGSLSQVLNPGLYLVRLHTDASATPPSFDTMRGNLCTGMLWDGVTNWQFIDTINKLSVTYAAAETPGTAWDTVTTAITPMRYRFTMSWTPT